MHSQPFYLPPGTQSQCATSLINLLANTFGVRIPKPEDNGKCAIAKLLPVTYHMFGKRHAYLCMHCAPDGWAATCVVSDVG